MAYFKDLDFVNDKYTYSFAGQCCRGGKKCGEHKYKDYSHSSSTGSKISTSSIQRIIESLSHKQMRESMRNNYLRIWRQFNRFLLRLDSMPKSWEDRATLFVGQLAHEGVQSNTIRCYISGIKKLLIEIDYAWDDNRLIVNSLTRACKLVNDHVSTRLPIRCSLLELILFEIERKFASHNQVYLEYLYKSIFMLGYYGLLRVSELVLSKHVVKAANIHVAVNKDKLLIILYSSKTHTEGMAPQKIKIVSNRTEVWQIFSS